MTDLPRPYTVQQLSERWQVSQESIYALIRRFTKGEPGGLPAFTVGGKLWRIKAEVVDQWESAGENTPLADIGSEHSSTKRLDGMRPSSAGETTTASLTDTDLVSSVRQRADLRLMHTLAGSKL